MSKPKQIKSVQHLIHKIKEGNIKYYISLANGSKKSEKHIDFSEEYNQFYIVNYMDDSRQTINRKDIHNTKLTNIGKAIELNALFMK